ncbi:MAG: polyprenyl synthetase family protein [Porphyromonas sp.]|nr:polyprenyl synthetase family protein [Porphyromonas sp.]
MKEIVSSIERELSLFKTKYIQALDSGSTTLSTALEHLYASMGKQVRPSILLLTAKCFSPISDQVLSAAVYIELLHTATLIHDDVVDDTPQRRGIPALHSVMDNKTAVLVGDFLLSTSLYLAVKSNSMAVLEVLMSLGRELSEGELYQLDMAQTEAPTEEQYLNIIRKKTAYLIASAMKIGVLLSDVTDKAVINKIFEAGILLGYAFQIKDDIFDYQEASSNEDLGKPVGNDLREHKVTIPLIYALSKAPDAEEYRDILRQDKLSEQQIDRLISFARENGGIEYAQSEVDRYIDQAIEILEEFVPESDARKDLIALCRFIGSRRR